MSGHRGLWFLSLALLMGAAAIPALGQQTGDAAAPGPEYKPEVSEYTVQPGDTLWDLSARIVGSPFLWPRVWSYNPEITNPHWIYPGDVVRFYPSEQELPRLTQLVASQREMPEEEPEVVAPAQPERSLPAVERVSTTPVRRAPSRTATMVNLFVTERELAESGTLTNAVADKMLLGPGDQVFLTFPKKAMPKAGDRFMVYRTVRKIPHPVNGHTYGYMTQVTGFATVSEIEDDVARARLDSSMIEIERGQLVTPLVITPIVDVKPRAASRQLDGYVIAVEAGVETVTAERGFVFVDLGKQSGLEVGNRLSVFISGDPLSNKSPGKLPATRVGTLIVVDTKDTAATCVVVNSRREIEPGLKVRTIVLDPAASGG